MIKAIIFDFDGVLVDSELSRFQSVQGIAKKHDITIPYKAFSQIIGKRTRPFLEEFITVKNKEAIIDLIIAEYEKSYKENITQFVEPISHSTEFIKNYTGPLRFAIASGSGKKIIETLLQHFGIEKYFTTIISNDDVENLKPHPETYLKALGKLHLSPDECVVIEDLVIGAQAAIKAGIRCYVLLNGMNSKEDFEGIPIAGFINSQEDFEKLV